MVEDIQHGRQPGVADKGIAGENYDESEILEHQGVAVAPAPHQAPDHGGEPDIDRAVHQEQERQVGGAVAEFLHHHEPGEHHENLPAGAGEKHQGVEKPVAAPQDQLLVLLVPGRDGGIGQEDHQGDHHGQSPSGKEDMAVRQRKQLEARVDQAERHQRGE